MNSKPFASYGETKNVELKELFENAKLYEKFLLKLNKCLPSYFEINRQNDVHEFLMYYIDILYEKDKKAFVYPLNVKKSDSAYKRMEYKCNESWYKAYSPIMDVMYFQLVRQTSCSLCDNTNLNIENNFILELDIVNDEKDTVEMSVSRYFDTLVVDDWTCDKCKMNSKENSIIQRLWMLPKTLIICIKRFKYINGKMRKLKYPISIPDTLDLTNYVLQKNVPKKYSLSGVINHLGNSYYGHYNADVIVNGEMIKIDDDVILKSKSLNEENAYILFYDQSA
jgi:ubiquitin C-terminal hydrolase